MMMMADFYPGLFPAPSGTSWKTLPGLIQFTQQCHLVGDNYSPSAIDFKRPEAEVCNLTSSWLYTLERWGWNLHWDLLDFSIQPLESSGWASPALCCVLTHVSSSLSSQAPVGEQGTYHSFQWSPLGLISQAFFQKSSGHWLGLSKIFSSSFEKIYVCSAHPSPLFHFPIAFFQKVKYISPKCICTL